MNKQVEQVLLGSLCGDGGVYKGGLLVNPFFQEIHSIKQKPYLLWKKDLLSSNFKMLVYEREYPSYIKGYIHSSHVIGIRTNSSPLLQKYRDMFYPKGHKSKKLSKHILMKMNWFAIAIWYMDDGYYNKYGNCIELVCERKNAKQVKSFFIQRFNMSSHIQYYKEGIKAARICFNTKSSKIFLEKVSPFIHESMKYKIIVNIEEHSKIRAARLLNYKNKIIKLEVKQNDRTNGPLHVLQEAS